MSKVTTKITQTIITLAQLQAAIESGDGAAILKAEFEALNQMDELTGDLESQSFGKVF